jgi:hypothetical protein
LLQGGRLVSAGARHDATVAFNAGCRGDATRYDELIAAHPGYTCSVNLQADTFSASPLDIRKEALMYAAIRQGKAKIGAAEELARRIKEGAIPIISDVEGFMAYYVVYAPDDTVTAISIFNNHAGAEESNKRGLAWIEENLAPLLTGPATAVAGPVIVHTLA